MAEPPIGSLLTFHKPLTIFGAEPTSSGKWTCSEPCIEVEKDTVWIICDYIYIPECYDPDRCICSDGYQFIALRTALLGRMYTASQDPWITVTNV